MTEVLLAFVVSALLLSTAISIYNRVSSHQAEYNAMTTYSAILGIADSLFANRTFIGLDVSSGTPTGALSKLLYSSLPTVIQAAIKRNELVIKGNTVNTFDIEFRNMTENGCLKTVSTMIEQERVITSLVGAVTYTGSNLDTTLGACPGTLKLTVR